MDRLETIFDILKPIIVIMFFVILVCLFVYGISQLNRIMCDAQTAQIGFAHRWSFWGDCQIQVTPGQWIPLSNYRFFEP
jgi:hypothetical protein